MSAKATGGRALLRHLVRIAGIAAVPALGYAALALYALAESNNQGELFDPATGAVDWPHALMMSSIFSLGAFMPALLLAGALYAAVLWAKR